MSDINIKAASSGTSPFDSIRRIEEGTEFWLARELMPLLEQFNIKTHLEVLNKQECGLLILEAAAIKSLETYAGVSADAAFLWDSAISIYEGQSATFIFNSVFQAIKHTIERESNETFLYTIIDKHFEVLFPEGKKLERDLYCDRKDIPDYFVLIDGNTIPVEVKAYTFLGCHLQQLNRYIKKYQPKELGFAIAPSIDPTLVLPEAIKFISLDREWVLKLEGYVSLRDMLDMQARKIILERIFQV